MVFKPQFIKRLGCREIPQWQDGYGVDLGGTQSVGLGETLVDQSS